MGEIQPHVHGSRASPEHGEGALLPAAQLLGQAGVGVEEQWGAAAHVEEGGSL